MKLTIRCPDDFHHHFRDGAELKAIVPLVAHRFKRAIAMPNVTPPVTTTELAMSYRERIMASVPEDVSEFEPLMTLYLTDNTTSEELKKAKASGKVVGCKLYPAGATTNSENGVTDIKQIYPVFKTMEEVDLVLLVHGEVFRTRTTEVSGDNQKRLVEKEVDIFEREKVFLETVLPDVVQSFPKLRIVLEHITTKEAVEFVLQQPKEARIAATITPQHLLFHRNKIFQGNLIRPHYFCMPILKSEEHLKALTGLLKQLSTGSKELEDYQKERFFLGTDSAAHSVKNKLNKNENNCGCAGVFSATNAIEFYTMAFDEALGSDREELEKTVEQFSSENGAKFYGLPLNEGSVQLKKEATVVPERVVFGDETADEYFVPMCAGETIPWTFTSSD